MDVLSIDFVIVIGVVEVTDFIQEISWFFPGWFAGTWGIELGDL